MRNRYSLNDPDVIELAGYALIIEKHYGRPMDIEWGKDGVDGKLYILQARPETVKSQSANQTEHRYKLKGHSAVLAEGRAIGQKIGTGPVRLVSHISEMDKVQPGDVLVLAHHRNDQAETVLLRLMRGSGVRGLAAMAETGVVPLQPRAIMCWRPWLGLHRGLIAAYARQQSLSWVEDESNTDSAFSRNYLRHQVLPVLEQRWGNVVNQLAETSLRMREADELLHELAQLDYQQVKAGQDALNIPALAALTTARRNNVLRYWLEQQRLNLPDHSGLLRLWREVGQAKNDATPLFKWRGVEIRRYRQCLYAMPPLFAFDHADIDWADLGKALYLPCGGRLDWAQASRGVKQELALNGCVSIRFRAGGEKIRPAGRQHHHDLKKLLQEAGVPPWQRERIPLLYIDRQLAAVIGYWVSDEFADKGSSSC